MKRRRRCSGRRASLASSTVAHSSAWPGLAHNGPMVGGSTSGTRATRGAPRCGLQGLLKVVLTSDQGEEIVLVTLSRHGIVGELAMLDGLPRSASVVAVEPTTVLIL